MKGVVSQELLASLHPLEVRLLPHLKDGIKLSELVQHTGMQEVEVMRACQWLENKKALSMDAASALEVHLGEHGAKAVEHGMPETRFLHALRQGAKTQEEVAAKAGLDLQEVSVSIGLLKKQGLLDAKQDKTLSLTKQGMTHDTNLDPQLSLLKRVATHFQPLDKLTPQEQELVQRLKQRKYLTIKEHKDRIVRLTELGKALVSIDVKSLGFAEKLTSDELKTGAWKEKQYRSYDVTINVPRAYGGKEHFVQEAIEHVRRIWIEMGFREMEGDMVQSAFWNMDALFVPQDHPARDVQDTFYLEHPARTTINKQAFERVRAAHETGGNGSKGWRYNFSKQEAERLLLRTHTTVLSAQTLWKIKEGALPIPGKYFAIGKNFRNEAVDWKHLFEFNQVEGIVVDPNVTFAQLLGYLKIFFAKMGYKNIRIRPHHFPYTEPSVEIDFWHEERKQWVELGGAGLFRPEVTKALLGEDIPVLAWGPGFDRIILEYFKIADMRDLYRNDIKQLREMRRYLKLEEE